MLEPYETQDMELRIQDVISCVMEGAGNRKAYEEYKKLTV